MLDVPFVLKQFTMDTVGYIFFDIAKLKCLLDPKAWFPFLLFRSTMNVKGMLIHGKIQEHFKISN